MQMNVFAHYARYYDLMYRDKDYQAESAFVHSLIKQYAPEAKAVLELGSGTGAHARYLAEMGFEVHGVDRSEPMLEMAQARRQDLPPVVAGKLSFSHGDVRQIRLEKTFDAVIALFHLISYQVSNEDMAATFRTISEHLQPGGVLIFDYWYGPTVLTERPSVRVKRVEDETVRLMRVVEPVMHTNKNVVEVNYQFFIQDKRTGVIETFREDHLMRYLFLPEIELFFANAGLMPVDHGDWMTGRAPGFDTWSVYSLGKK
jgi:SAM-dependent methyltransferase